MSKFIGYARVSTSDQNPSLQIDALKAAGVAEENIFVEHKSGKNLDRPELKKCLNALEEGDTLIVWKMDRLGRSIKDLVNIMSDLDERKVSVNFLDAGFINRNSAIGQAMFNMIGTMAQLERDMIVERTRAGLAAARKRGKVGGRPKKQKDDPYCLAAKKMQEEGKTVKQIHEALKASGKKVCRRTIFYWLSRSNAA